MPEIVQVGYHQIPIYSEEEIQGIKKAGNIAAQTLDYLYEFVEAGVSTAKLDSLAQQFIESKGAISATIGYRGYQHASCISVNHVICHGIPNEKKKLKNGDILNIDITVIVDGYFGDTSRMYYVGTPPVKAQKLVETTFDAMWAAINIVKPEAYIGDIGGAIKDVAHKQRYSVVYDFVGHGIGTKFHHAPEIQHHADYGTGIKMMENMVFTIEPMINVGKPDSKVLADGWTAVTKDKSLSAQFEHTIVVRKDGFEVLTLSPKGLDKPF